MALKKMPDGGAIAERLRRAIRRWKWPIVAAILSITMTYVMYWTGPQPYQSTTFGILPIFLSYGLLALCFFVIITGILYEFYTEFRTYYICESCKKNFVYKGKIQLCLDGLYPHFQFFSDFFLFGPDVLRIHMHGFT